MIPIIRRELSLAFGQGGGMMPILFFLLVATLYPFAIGPDALLLGKTGGGILWIAALLAALLPVDRLIRPDHENGMLDQYQVRGVTDETVALAKMIGHWLGFGPPLMLAVLPAAALLKLDAAIVLRLELGLAIGTPGLAALALATASLTVGLRGAAALAGLLMLPLCIPLLIFGAGSLAPDGMGALKLLGAVSLVLVAGAPFAAGAALRAMRD